MYNKQFFKPEIANALTFSAEDKNVWNSASTTLYLHSIMLT
jgi:hypothetical protein